MKRYSLNLLILLFAGIVIFNSCKKEYSCENCGVNPPVNTNKPPIANAGTNQTIILPTDSIIVDGSASSDPDGTISSFFWTKISGPAFFTITNASAARTGVKNLVAGSYQFELKVTDNGGLFTKDTMIVIVDSVITTNHPPVANAGADQSITLPVNTVTLDGSVSFDPENNITGYLWTKISGPSSFNITNTNAMQTQVTNLVQGVYQFELKVTDAGALFSKDTMQVTAIVQPPACDISNRPLVNAQLIPVGTLSQARAGMSVASINNKIIFSGGGYVTGSPTSSRVDIFDISSNSWTTAELSQARWGMATAVLNNKVFFAGGGPRYDNVDIYDVSTNTWTLAHLSEPRSLLAGSSIGNKAFFAGGTTNNNEDANRKVDIYDNNTNSWSTAMLTEGRFDLSAVTAGDKIYFAGGSDLAANSLTTIDIYDNITNTWSVSYLQYASDGNTGTTVFDRIYWAATSRVEVRDITSGTTFLHCLSYGRYLPGIAVKDNKIVFFTGANAWGGLNDRFDIYDILSNTWSIGILPAGIYGASIISVNNTIYVAGGIVNGTVSNQVWKLEF